MGASYELSKREGRLGGPEKRTCPIAIPWRRIILTGSALSELGRRAYEHYWSQTIARTILQVPDKKIITVLDLRKETYIVPDDIITTLQKMQVLDQKTKGEDSVINKAKVRAWVEANKVNLTPPVDKDGFVEMSIEEEEEEDENDEEEEDEDDSA